MPKRVLVVEDDFFLAMETAETIRVVGGEVVGPVAGVKDALALLECEVPVDLVVLDVKLVDGTSYPVAVEAKRRSIPLAFLTAYDRSFIDPAHQDVPTYSKPCSEADAGELMKLAA